MFKRSSMDVGLTPPIEYHPGKAGEAIVLGEALTLTAGALTKCGAAAKPQFIAVGPSNAAGEVPVVAVQDYMTFETQLQAAGDALKIGDKVTLHEDGRSEFCGELTSFAMRELSPEGRMRAICRK